MSACPPTLRNHSGFHPNDPVYHVHVSGSAGTTFFKIAVAANSHLYPRAFPASLNANLACRTQTSWKISASRSHCIQAQCKGKTCGRGGNCEHLRYSLKSRNIVYAATESLLDDAKRESPPAVARELGPTLFHLNMSGQSKSAYTLERDAVERSPWERQYPLHGFQPLGSHCSGLRYSLLMSNPIKRIATQLLLHCKVSWWPLGEAQCGKWAADALAKIYDKAMFLDFADGAGFSGTPSASNAYIRFLLGPTVYFAPLEALNRSHLEAAKCLLSRFAFVAPVERLNASLPVLRHNLGWHNLTRKHAAGLMSNTHYITGRSMKDHERVREDRQQLLRPGSDSEQALRRHNALDLELFEWVTARFEDDLRRRRAETEPFR